MRGSLWIAIALVTIAATSPATAAPYDQGKFTFGLILGGSFGQNATILAGGGAGYFVIDGLEVGLSAHHVFGQDPPVSSLTPGVQYILHFLPSLTPYVGAFYRHRFVGDGCTDFDSVGFRGGLFFIITERLSVSIGVAYEVVVSDRVNSCLLILGDRVVPELSFGVAF